VILLDAVMPGLSGFAVCETLRENPATSSIPILMLTGLSSHISQITAFESGATDYLIKPFVLEELVFKVKKLLDKVDKADQLAAEQKKLASQDRSCLHEWLSQAPSGGE
jgi:DNA-binding response OmpR family regulator